jgi:NitT/TauT family transport system permease protein
MNPFSIHFNIPPWGKFLLGAIPFVLILLTYGHFSHERKKDNPKDKLLPSFSEMLNAADRAWNEKSKRTDTYIMREDTLASLQRLGIGLGLTTLTAVVFGILMGLFPLADGLFNIFLRFISIIPPLAILPILFISFGVDELAKVMLIYLGTTFIAIRDIKEKVQSINKEQITKALTLGASQGQLIVKIVLPMVLPRVITALRLALPAAWLFLIASEAIASTNGLGYRIYLVRRYMDMATIIPYAVWITVMGISFDFLLAKLSQMFFPWSEDKDSWLGLWYRKFMGRLFYQKASEILTQKKLKAH